MPAVEIPLAALLVKFQLEATHLPKIVNNRNNRTKRSNTEMVDTLRFYSAFWLPRGPQIGMLQHFSQLA